MSQALPDARPLKDLFAADAQTPFSALGRAQRLADMTQALRQWRPEPWMEHIRIANLREDVVVVYSSSAAALIPLRQLKKPLLDFLNQRYQLRCCELEAKVRPVPGT